MTIKWYLCKGGSQLSDITRGNYFLFPNVEIYFIYEGLKSHKSQSLWMLKYIKEKLDNETFVSGSRNLIFHMTQLVKKLNYDLMILISYNISQRCGSYN